MPALKARLFDDFMAWDRPARTQLLTIIQNVSKPSVYCCLGSLLSSVFRVFLGGKRGGGAGRGKGASPVATSYPDRTATAFPVFSTIKNRGTEVNDADLGGGGLFTPIHRFSTATSRSSVLIFGVAIIKDVRELYVTDQWAIVSYELPETPGVILACLSTIQRSLGEK